MTAVLDELRQAETWSRRGPVALATVVSSSGSAPRLPGSAMAVSPGGEVAGSLSGGCVEASVYELARETLDTGRPGLHRFGVSDDDAFAAGLTCGGEIEVFVQRLQGSRDAGLDVLLDEAAARRPVATATVIAHDVADLVGTRITVRPDDHVVHGPLDRAWFRLARVVTTDSRGMLASGMSGCLSYGAHGERLGDSTRVFVHSLRPPPRLIIFGAVAFAAALARVGSLLGYHVTVCDARPVFTTPRRFPGAHEVVVDWPHRFLRAEIDAGRADARTAVCVLTHDSRFDVPALEVALAADLAYVGAMGSRRTHEDRLTRLREAGVPEEQLATLRSPLGLDLGARTPEETAVSIAAEIIATRWGGSGRQLAQTTGGIHGEPQGSSAPSALVAW